MEISHTEWNQMKDDIGEIKEAILPTKFNNNKGLIWVIDDHHRRLSELEKYRDDEIVRMRFQQDRDKRTQNLIKTFLAVVTILSLIYTFYKNKN